MSLTLHDRIVKRLIDIFLSLFVLVLILPLLLIILILCSIDTKSTGIYTQIRIGQYGKPFKLYKFKTMIDSLSIQDEEISKKDSRISFLGAFFRRTKLDELPQFWNVLKGDMSIVGPRPDVPGYADLLEGHQRLILSVRPGITGPASIIYTQEAQFLSKEENPKKYNDEVIWPDKVRLNLHYINNFRLSTDLKLMVKTIVKILSGH